MPHIRSIAHALARLVAHPRTSLSAVLDTTAPMTAAANKTAAGMGFGNGFPDVTLLDLIPDFDEKVVPYSYLSDTSLAIDIALLKALIRQREDCSYLEIGTWRGESLANAASVAASCTSVSLSPEHLIERGYGEKFAQVQGFFTADLENVTRIGADSQTFDFDSLGRKFDVIFIDGDHVRESISRDTQNAFSLLRDERSVIVWHDYGWTTERIRWTSVAGILDGCPPQFRSNLYHVATTMCALFTQWDVPSVEATFPRMPDTVYEVSIQGKKVDGGR